MPPTTQRRNTAYLNRADWRFGGEDRALHAQAPRHWTGLAIDLGGSVELRFRPDELSGLCLWLRRPLGAATTKGEDRTALRLDDLCVLTVELSGAAAAV
jgi:hypothetical protein